MPLIPAQAIEVRFSGPSGGLLAVNLLLNTDYIAVVETPKTVPTAITGKFGSNLVDVTMAHPRDRVYRCLGKPEDFLPKEDGQ